MKAVPFFLPEQVDSALPESIRKRHKEFHTQLAGICEKRDVLEAELQGIRARILTDMDFGAADAARAPGRKRFTLLQEEMKIRREYGDWLSGDYLVAISAMNDALGPTIEAVFSKVKKDLEGIGFTAEVLDTAIARPLITTHPDCLAAANRRDAIAEMVSGLLNPLLYETSSPIMVNKSRIDAIGQELEEASRKAAALAGCI